MAKTNQRKSLNFKNIILIAYVGICLLMVAITMGLSFFDASLSAVEVTPTVSPTKNSVILTMQAESYESDDDEHHGQGQGQGRNAGAHSTAEATATP